MSFFYGSTAARWFLEVKQDNVHGRIHIDLRPSPSAFALPGPREVVWRGAIPLGGTLPALAAVMVRIWEKTHGAPRRRTAGRKNVQWFVAVSGFTVQCWEEIRAPRVANILGFTDRCMGVVSAL